MIKNKIYLVSLLFLTLLSGCYNRDIHSVAPIVAPLSNLKYTVDDDTLRVSWDLPQSSETLSVRVMSTADASILTNNPTSYTFGVVKVGQPYTFTFKAEDTDGNLSTGQSISFIREGASSVQDLMAHQPDNVYDVVVNWALPSEKLSKIEIRYDDQKIDLSGDATTYTIKNASQKVYTIGVVSYNAQDQSSETAYTTIRVGSTKVAFLGVAATRAGITDDDEKAAADWFFSNYPTGTYVSFADIKAGADLSQYRLLWWIRDVSSGDLIPTEALDPTVLNAIKQYHANGGNLLLNTDACLYLWNIGRMTANFNKGIDLGDGFDNPDVWSINTTIGNTHDESTQPIYRGLSFTSLGVQKCIPTIGPGWKENHNVVFTALPNYYGYANNDENAYVKITTDSNIRILGTWAGISDYYMMGMFETLPTTQFKGSSIAIGIGGFEWNQNNVVNPYQNNIETITQNAIEYLKTK